MGRHPAALPEAVPEKGVGIGLQAVKQTEHDLLLGEADARLVIAHGGLGHPQQLRQGGLRKAQRFPLFLDPLSKAHGHSSLRRFSLSYAIFLVMSNYFNKFLVKPLDSIEHMCYIFNCKQVSCYFLLT